MFGLIESLYPDDEKRKTTIQSLYNDCDEYDRLLIRGTLAESLKDYPHILPSHGMDWILCTLSLYHKSENDTVRIFQSIIKKMNEISFGLLTEKIEYKEMDDIADSCIVGVGFFREKMEKLHQKHGAPSVSYYIDVGSLAFNRVGYNNIGRDFIGWVKFIEKELTTISFM